MGSEPDVTDPTLSRESSFFSLELDSVSSVYVTAQESLRTSDEGGNSRSKIAKCGRSDELNVGSATSLSGTTGEYQDMDGSSDSFDESLCSPVEQLVDDNNGRTRDDKNDEDFELKADVSKICNDIAEAIQPDVKKKAEINLAIASHSASSLKELRKLAISEGGLLSNVLRKSSWATLLGISKKDIELLEKTRIPSCDVNVTLEIKNLVNMDVARVLKRFPPGLSDPQQEHLQTWLSKLIISVLHKNPEAYYYQGFHDISLTFALVCILQGSPNLAYLCLDKMIETCLAPFMEKTMESTHDLIHVLFAILESEDIDLFNKIVKDTKCPAAFCLPWVLTWFSHTLPSDNDVFRVYDFILGCMDEVSPSYLIPIFISAALVLRNSSKIKSIRETDIATMHQNLSRLPFQQDSLEPWLKDSLKLMKAYKAKEMQLVGRAVHIKELQNQLWNSDNRNRNRASSSAYHYSSLTSIGRFIFVKHRWCTLALIVLGTAYLIRVTYGSSMQPAFVAAMEDFIPEPLKSFCRDYLEFQGLI